MFLNCQQILRSCPLNWVLMTDDGLCSGCQNGSQCHQLQLFSGPLSPFTIESTEYDVLVKWRFVFSLWCSISQQTINTVAVNATGEWLAFGCSDFGQLLVWEWQSETYILKQQGHYYDMNTLCYSQDGHHVATGGDDGKVQWHVCFCFELMKLASLWRSKHCLCL